MSYYPISDANSSTKGLIQLAGDISGSAGSPTIPALANKADAADVYTKAETDATLAAKADTTALSNYVPTSQRGAANGVATLDATGKVPLTQLQLAFPVTSVASKTGDVTLTKSDVGLDNVDNTSDANKPISSATQTALNSKASSTHTHVISDTTNLQTSLDAKADASTVATALAGKADTSHTHPISDVTNLQTSLDGKASNVHTHAISDVTNLQTSLDAKAAASHTHTAADISDSSAVGRSVLTAADTLTAQSALGITNTVVVVDSFGDVTTPSYGTLYVVRA